jgi:transcriptional regulator with XRE-family HTH domain
MTTVPRDHFDFWVAAEVGAIIAAAGQCHRTFSWEPQRAFRALCKEHRLTPGEFARAIGTGKLTTWCWLNGKARPSLGSALRVYHRFGLSLAAALVGVAPQGKAGHEARQGEIHLRSRRRARRIDWQAIQDELMSELRRPIGAAPTLLAVSQRLDIARRTLRVHEPALCRQIASRHRERVRLEAALRAESLAAEMRAAISVFRSHAMVPTWRELEEAMGRPNLFNSSYARQIVRPLMSTWASVLPGEHYVENPPHP